MLADCPDYVSVGSLLKAHTATEGERRFIYFEASNEGNDQQNEVVLAKALNDSRDIYLRHGNVDVDHFTQIGARLGIPDYPFYEIGQPVEVGQRGGATFVKSELYRGTTKAAEMANTVWSSMTELNPPQRWYPSVGGAVLQKSVETDPKTQARRAVIAKVRWTNVGLSKTPVNQHVGACQAVPVGIFAKSMVAADMLDMSLIKTLTAGYGTDSASLTGGAALRMQSLDGAPKNYFDFRNKLATAIQTGAVDQGDHAGLTSYSASQFGFSRDDAAEYVERFLRDLHAGIQKKRTAQ